MQSPVKLAATKALAAATAAILVVAGLAVAIPADDSGDDSGDEAALDTLLAAAEATEAVGSADVEVVGDAHTAVKRDLEEFLSEIPDLDETTGPDLDEMIGHLDESLPPKLPQIPTLDCEDVPADMCDRMRRQLDDARGRLEHSRSGRGGGAEARERMRSRLAEAQERFEERLAEIPDEFRCDYHFEGSGTMTIPGTVEISGEADVSCDPDFVDGRGNFDTVLSHDVAFNDNGDGTFTAAPRAGVGAALVADGRSIADLLRKADDIDDGGIERLDGVEVRHVSFAADEGPVTFSVDVWIGVEDHVVRKLVTRSSGQVAREGIEAEFEAEHTVLVTNVRVERPTDPIEIPDFDDVVPTPPAAERFDDLTNPFGDAMPSAGFRSEVSTSS